eukprot:scaffold36710_cov58-Attheya_sp.AAC.1
MAGNGDPLLLSQLPACTCCLLSQRQGRALFIIIASIRISIPSLFDSCFHLNDRIDSARNNRIESRKATTIQDHI